MVANLAMKPSTTINNNIVLQPIVISNWDQADLFSELASVELLRRGITNFYENLFTKLFVNEDQTLKIQCVNKRKRIFQYKAENGAIVRDEKLCQFIEEFINRLAGRLKILNWEIVQEIHDLTRSTKMRKAIKLRCPNFSAFVASKT